MRRGRRSLSNIIGSVILIAATIVGGLMVYSYFQRSLGAFMNMGSTVAVEATQEPLNGTASLIYVKITNEEPYAINLTSLYVVLANGSSKAYYVVSGPSYSVGLSTTPPTGGGAGIVINPGSSITILQSVVVGSQGISRVYVAYSPRGSSALYYSQPVSVSQG